MTKATKEKDTEMLVQAVAYLEDLIVPSKDLVCIYCTVCCLRKTIKNGGGTND